MIIDVTKLSHLKSYQLRSRYNGTTEVTVPKVWAQMIGVSEGERIAMFSDDSGALVLIPEKKLERQEQPA